MALEGRLRELGLAEVLQLLELSRKTGLLTVRSDARERPAVVRFDGGAIVGAEVPDHDARLGMLLLRSGRISELEMERVLREQRQQPAVPFGTLAVQLGLVSVGDVKRQLAYQIEETVFELLRWSDGLFRFEEAPAAPDGIVPVRIPTQSLLMEAARRMDEWAALATRVPHGNVVPALSVGGVDAAAPLDLKPQEWEILAEIDGERSVKQIAIDLGRSEFEVARTVFGLIAVQVVELAGEAPAQRATTRAAGRLGATLADAEYALRARRPEEAQRLLERPVTDHPDHPEVQLLMGRTLYALGRWHEAADCLARAVRLDPLSAVGHYLLGFAATRAGDLPRAEHAWAIYLRLPDARSGRGELVRRAHEAVATLREIVEAEAAAV